MARIVQSQSFSPTNRRSAAGVSGQSGVSGMAVNAQGVDVTEELAERASEAFAAQQDKKVMKKLKLSADCIPADKIADFLRAMGCNPSSAEIVEATQYADPDGEGVARLPSLMKPLALLLAKPPITESDLTAALGVFEPVAFSVGFEDGPLLLQ